MIYYTDAELMIRSICQSDPRTICAEEIAQGWLDATEDKYNMRLKDDRAGVSVGLVAQYLGNVAGYVNVYPGRIELDGRKYCEIVDFGVLEKYRCRGIGSKLMDVAERIAKEYADTVYIGVGLHSGYGSAQRMYVKRGYVPDGNGVWYDKALCVPYKTYCNDDSLFLRLSKKLK